jgi:hypothetical protein
MTITTSFAVRLAAALCVAGCAGTAAGADDYMTERMPYAAFDRLPQTRLLVAGSAIDVGFAPGAMRLPKDELLAWVRRSAESVTVYYGTFPVARTRLLVVPVDGDRVRSGTTWGYQGNAIRVIVGRDSDDAALRRDWVMVHEMIHLALPQLDRRHNWLAEGISVYVESIARVQSGDLDERQIWRDFATAMPKGLPADGDRGLDFTPTWGRTYWGGAIFCLQADIELRRRTAGKFGLQDALKGILALGGHEQDRTIAEVLEAGDRATGTTVLADLYREMGDKPVVVDLEGIWRQLGVELAGTSVTLDETAPAAAIRRAIVARS